MPKTTAWDWLLRNRDAKWQGVPRDKRGGAHVHTDSCNDDVGCIRRYVDDTNEHKCNDDDGNKVDSIPNNKANTKDDSKPPKNNRK